MNKETDPSSIDLSPLRHSLAHLLGAAVLELYPDAKLTLGPAVDDGFYYDVDFGITKVTEADLVTIETRMRALLPTWTGFIQKEVLGDLASAHFQNNEYKQELIGEIIKKGEAITFYTSGEFTDLCRGGHVDNMQDIPADCWRLDRIAGAYWRGDENNKMLTRIYGLAFESKEKLEEYLTRQEEARKRDHRRFAREHDLLVFSDLVGQGLPLYTPKGNIIRNAIVNYSRELNDKLGFGEVHTPNINKGELFKLSGHYDKYKDDMLQVSSQYVKDEMFLKPMNCPQHTQIYASSPRSYRDLPIRYADFAVLYRDERPGEMSGLTRLRAFAQDDGHIFCREDQIEAEISAILSTIQEALRTYGVSYWMRLSLRDEAKKENYLGTDNIWDRSQGILRKLLEEKNITFKPAEGEAAFYGPKIDIMAVDAIGREWQISTVQLDFSMPTRFKLTYTDKDGSDQTPVMIHRALIGSPDRFLGLLIEHYAGAFPTWMAPVQSKILPVSDKFLGYAEEVFAKLKEEGVRVTLDDSKESLGKKIRDAKLEKVPYLIIIGEKEVTDQTITVEKRGSTEKGTPEKLEGFIEKITKEIKERSLD